MPRRTKQPNEARIFIGLPLGSPFIYWQTVLSLLNLDRPAETELVVFQGALVDRARNQLIEQMLEHPMEATHLFFIDADIIVPPEALAQLLAHNVPCVSGLYRKRLPPYEPMAFHEKKGIYEPLKLPCSGLQHVSVVGAGCLLVERELLEKMPVPWFTNVWEDTQHLSEDFAFCRKVYAAGEKVYVDPELETLHIEPMGVGSDAKGKVHFKALL